MENWKINFYNKYSTYCNQIVTEDFYKKYIPYAKNILSEAKIDDKSMKILDLGCGLGGFIKYFKQCGFLNVIGVDTSNENIEIAKSFGIDFIQLGDVFDFLKTNQNKYDIILALDLIEHFNIEDTIQFLTLVNLNLNVNGKIVIHTPNAEGIFGSKIRYSDITHERAFTKNSMSQLGLYSGFKSITCVEDRPQIYSISSFVRRVLWVLFTIQFRIIHAAETGSFNVILSQNFLTIMQK